MSYESFTEAQKGTYVERFTNVHVVKMSDIT